MTIGGGQFGFDPVKYGLAIDKPAASCRCQAEQNLLPDSLEIILGDRAIVVGQAKHAGTLPLMLGMKSYPPHAKAAFDQVAHYVRNGPSLGKGDRLHFGEERSGKS